MEHYQGILGFIILILDIWAIVSIVTSDRETGAKVLWTVLVLILPIIGFVIWLIVGPRAKKSV